MEWIHEGRPPFNSQADVWMANGSVRRVTYTAHGWRYIDCTYPEQNVICEPTDIVAWRPSFIQPNFPPAYADQPEPGSSFFLEDLVTAVLGSHF